ncbi:MAG: DUF2878 domain-containing protein [Planctomycetota bacterium]|jgi:hypothetical protein
MQLIAIVVGYYAVWFLSVLGREGWWGGAAALLVLVGLALRSRPFGARWFLLPPLAFLFGLAIDGLLASQGAMTYRHDAFLFGLPLWMPMLWAVFAGAIPFLLASFRERLALISLLGALGGPLTYLSAGRLGAVTSVDPWAWWVIALEWAVFPPLVLWLIVPKKPNPVTAT